MRIAINAIRKHQMMSDQDAYDAAVDMAAEKQ
jgi:hypothetical protein